MKTLKYHFLFLASIIVFSSYAQTSENLVLWDFRSTVGITTSFDYATSPVYPDDSNSNNTTATFFTDGRKITGQNGYVFSTGWLFNETPRYWTFDSINTNGYFSLSFVFDMGGSSGNAPRDFELEYRISESENWISLGAFMSPQGFATKTYALPRECENTIISLRIRLISNYKINGINEAQTNTQNRLKNVRITGYVEPTQPSIITSMSTYSVCEVEINKPVSFYIDITGKKLTGPLSLSIAEPFTVSKSTLVPTDKTVTEAIEINFTPRVGGEYNERLIINGGGAEPNIVHLRAVAAGYQLPPLPTGIQTIKNILAYQLQTMKNGISLNNTQGDKILLFDITGVLLKQIEGKGKNQFISIPVKGIYLVQIGSFVDKIIIN